MKFFKSMHSVAGTAISVLFFMWFFTGVVLIYHPYPRLDNGAANHHHETIQADSLRPLAYYVDSLVADTIQSLRIVQRMGQPLVQVTTADSAYTFCADTTLRKPSVTFDYCKSVAAQWIASVPSKVDTLHERVQWILYERYERAMPIYRFTYDDAEGHELFISGKTGEVQQLTTRSERLWAWLGAIPHKFYYPCIRKDVDLWKTVITVGGILCLLCALSGVVHGVGLQVRIYRRKGKWANPFRKPLYKWHHALGLVFGLFILCWGISGSLAMQKVPKWLVPYERDYSMYAPDIWEGDSLPLHAFRLDYRKVLAERPEVKQIEWHVVGGRPVYTFVSDSTECIIDASDTIPQPLHVASDSILTAMHRLYGDETPVTVTLQTEYDQYYMPSFDMDLPLPVYRVDIGDADGSVYYIGTDTDYCRFYNTNKKVRKWLFGAMHYLNINGLVTRPALWYTCIWVLCLGGMAVSLTGVFLGVRYLRRKFRRSSHR